MSDILLTKCQDDLLRVSAELDAAKDRIAELEAENERAFDETVQRQEADADLQNALDSRDQWFEKYEAACSRIAELEGASDE